MEMEMDIPLPEELEWLESNAILPEEEEEDDDFYFPDEQQQLHLPPQPSSPISDPDKQASRKTPPSEVQESNAENRKRKLSETGTDEDWLLYSPPPKSPARETTAVAPESVDEESSGTTPEKTLSRFASEIDGECISVTGHEGERVYAKMSRWQVIGGCRKLNIETLSNGLLSHPIDVLMERVEQEAFSRALQASSESPNDMAADPATPAISEKLWVDKYAPNSFTELLSDEQTNREVLLWLKQWDSCVFGSQIRATTDDVLSALKRHSSVSQHQQFSDGKSFFNKNKGSPFSSHLSKQPNSLYQQDDSSKSVPELWKRKSLSNDPADQKILLLCGPPGLGKTTLAHVAAKHCGYRVVEINASDDRSSSMIESKILDAVQMNSVMADAKPKCLVIDEIDGALGEGKGAVDVILKILAAEKKSVGKENITQDAQGKVSSKKRSKAATLTRPIICICNDLFAPALRPLRQVAKVHMFVQPTVSRVVNRLKFICNKEGFKTSSIALTALAQYTKCDIRSCLNTLQFLNKKKETLSLELDCQVVGRKDMSKSAFDVWKEVFQKRKTKHERRPMNGSSAAADDFNFLYSLISSRGDYELTMDGIHENFLNLHYHDPVMQKTVKCLNALGVSDSLVQYTMRTQQMSLFVYQPSIAIAVRSLISQVEKPNIEWPKSFHRCRAMLREKRELLKFWHNKISPSISRHLSIASFVEDMISPLLKILSPNLRTVALHLLSEREKDDLAQLVNTMVSYSITYKKFRPELHPGTQRHEAATDASALSLDPPIGDFVNFKGHLTEHSGLSLAMRQVLVHEVEKQKILRESIGRSEQPNDGSNGATKSQAMEGSTKAFSLETKFTTAYAKSDTQNPMDKLSLQEGKADASIKLTSESNKNAPAVGMKSKAPGDFKKRSCGSVFDRFRKPNSKSFKDSDDALKKAATLERDSRPLLFKFNEGFTNAVKRPVRMRELL